MCSACRDDFFRHDATRCIQCAITISLIDTQLRCGECLREQPQFDRTITACTYAAPVDKLVLTLKFGHQLALAELMAQQLRNSIARYSWEFLPEILCPAPLSRHSLSQRGFNQSLEIAKPLSRDLGIPLQPGLLLKTNETLQQSTLHPEARRKNVKNAFILNPPLAQLVIGKHIGVVDDVMTTGATLDEIATLLKRFGAKKVSNLIFARTPKV
jgi:ComF family protein